MKNKVNCPQCQTESILIYSISFNSHLSDYLIKYKCSKYHTNSETFLRTLLLSFNSSHPNYPSYCGEHPFNPAPYPCPSCETFYCKECYAYHLINEKKNHLKDYLSTFCLKHNSEVINYCIKCKKKVCMTCINTQHSDHCDWEFLNNTRNNLFHQVNDKIKNVYQLYQQTNQYLDSLIDKAKQIRNDLRDLYENYLNLTLPLINLYKYLIFSTLNSPTNELHHTINSFDFGYVLENLSVDIKDDIMTKIKNEYDIMSKSLTITEKNINYLFSKQNFRFFNKNIVKKSRINNSNPVPIQVDGLFVQKNKNKPFTHNISTLSKHTGTVYCLTNLSSGNFASASADGTIIIWDCYLLQMNVSLLAHSESINSIIEHNNTLISCSNDNSIKIWTLDTLSLIKKITVKLPVISIFPLSTNLLVSFSGDELKIWSLSDYVCTFTCQIVDATYINKINENYFAAGIEDFTIMIFDIFNINNPNKLITLTGNKDNISVITPLNSSVICSGSYDGNIMVWDLNKKKTIIEFIKAHDFVIHAIVALNDNCTIASTSNDKAIKMWNLNTQQCTITIIGAHNGSIRAMIQLINGKIVSGSSDETVKIWG